MDPSLCIATPQHADDIRRLIRIDEVDGLECMDWSDLGGQWLVAVHQGAIVGCVQMMPGKPIARIEHMGLDEGMTPQLRARVVSMVVTHAFMLLRATGAQAIMTLVPHELGSYRKILERRGAIAVSDGTMLIKRLV